MPRNTFIFVSFLAIFAALVLGVNIGSKYFVSNQKSTSFEKNNKPESNLTPTIKQLIYQSRHCGISFNYPGNLTKMEAVDGNVMFLDSVNPGSSFVLICQEAVPKPLISQTEIENLSIGTISAKLYNDVTPEGTPSPKLIFKNPNSDLDILFSGGINSLRQIISSIRIL